MLTAPENQNYLQSQSESCVFVRQTAHQQVMKRLLSYSMSIFHHFLQRQAKLFNRRNATSYTLT